MNSRHHEHLSGFMFFFFYFILLKDYLYFSALCFNLRYFYDLFLTIYFQKAYYSISGHHKIIFEAFIILISIYKNIITFCWFYVLIHIIFSHLTFKKHNVPLRRRKAFFLFISFYRKHF